MKLAEIENVVRVIFPLTMMREGELLPAAFRLREKKRWRRTILVGVSSVCKYIS